MKSLACCVATAPCYRTGSGPKDSLSSTTVDGFNNKAKLTTREAFGFRSYKRCIIHLGIYHNPVCPQILLKSHVY
ncbi:MAG: transposase [Pyrinomonadaceae bacterium]